MFEQVASLKNMMSRIKAERSENDSLSEQELMELQSQRRDPKEKKLEQVRSEYMDFRSHPLAQKIDAFRTLSKTFGIENPFFRVHENVHGTRTTIAGRDCINFSGYNYLGFNDHPVLRRSVADAVLKYGTSVGASRLVAGERPFHRQLENKLSALYEKEDAIAFVSGHATNVSVISVLFGAGDLIVYDGLSHNSIIEGVKLSGARFYPYPHNDPEALEKILENHRTEYQRTLIVTEGLFSMDGDVPDLDRLIEIKNKYGCILMIDEAHALGVLGSHGRGLHEYFAEKSMVCRRNQSDCGEFNIAEKVSRYSGEVDLWMGTLSKTLAGCGGYIAADRQIIDILKFNAPGFVYSVGLSAPMAVAASAALDLMLKDNAPVMRLQHNAGFFVSKLKSFGLNTGKSIGYAVIPVIVGSSHRAVNMSNALYERGINVQPIIHPAVEEQQARLRFFITSEHTESELSETADLLAEAARKEGLIK